MSRWIDADALKEDVARLHVLNDEAEIRRAYEYNPHVTSTDFEETLVSVFDAINDAPSIDIVRCQDCKYWVYHFNGCSRNPCTEPWHATDGCSYGEREGE